MIATLDPDRFSVVTIFDAASPAPPAWAPILGQRGGAAQAVPLNVMSRADRKVWAARLDDAVRSADRAVLLVAEGLGCAASAWWARLTPSQDVARVAGALLFAPEPDGERARGALFASPATSLPFPSLVIRSSVESQELDATVHRWGSRAVIGERASVRPTGGTPWGHAQRLFLRLTSHVVEHEVRRVTALAPRR